VVIIVLVYEKDQAKQFYLGALAVISPELIDNWLYRIT